MKKLTKLFLLFIVLSISSCSEDNDVPNLENADITIPENIEISKGGEEYLSLLSYDSTNNDMEGDTINMISELNTEKLSSKMAKSSYLENELDQFADYPLYIRVKEGTSSSRYLRTNGVNKELTLAPFDSENSIYFSFYLNRTPLVGYMSIQGWTRKIKGLNSIINPIWEKKLISSGYYTNNSNKTILYAKEGNSSAGSMWDIAQITSQDGNGAYVMYNTDLRDSNDFFSNLCLQAEGSALGFARYVSKGQQQFEIIPAGDFEIIKLELINDDAAYVVKQPDFVATWSYNNNSDIIQKMSTSFSKKASYTSSFSHNHSLSINVSTSIAIGGAFWADGKITTSIGNTNQWTYGTTESSEDSRTYNFPIDIPVRTKIVAKVFVSRYEMNLKYKAVFREKATGKTFTENGLWTGIDCSDIVVDVQSENSQGIKKTSFVGIPKSVVRL